MKRRIAVIGALAVAAGTFAFSTTGAPASAAGGGTRQIPSAGTTAIRTTPEGIGTAGGPEFPSDPDSGKGEPSVKPVTSSIIPPAPLPTPRVKSSRVAPTNPEVLASVNGLNHRNQRLANGGNQFSLEPPDQALCVGNGFVVESVNSVLKVYDSTTGAAVTGVEDLNTFFGYPAAIDRSTRTFGPNVIDPICTYDPDNGRFVVAITTLDQDPASGDFTGKNTIDVAVSNTNDPTGDWTIYHVPAQNDGTDGTPDHHCTLDGVTPGPCFQDYPHIGGDKNGIYITTNEYDLFGPSYNAAQIFAFSKAQLAAHPASVSVTLVENLHLAGTPGFTVWPATSPAGQYESAANGTEYFLSTIAGDGSETGNPTGTNNKIGLWALSNTASLNSATPALNISSRPIDSRTYVVPPLSEQKAGPTPLGECINDTTIPTPFGAGCWNIFFASEPDHTEVESHLDSSDARMQQTWYTNHTLWGAAGTEVKVNGQAKAGIVWFKVQPSVNSNGDVRGEVDESGYLGLANNNLTYPALAMNTKGKGVIAFTVVGTDYFPSAGYATINSDGEVGPVHIAAAGLGPSDGFTSYKSFVGNPPRTRWGDYGAAVTEGDNIWIASEYIAQTCTLTQYLTGAIGSCGGTRTSLANWATRLTKVKP
jgi:hypothetical protein